MAILGYLTGKTRVRCAECKNLIQSKCYDKVLIPKEEWNQDRVCGFWQKK